MTSSPAISLPARWSPVDLFLHAFLAINPLALGLWIFTFAPLVGGNLVVAFLIAGLAMILGGIVYGGLSAGNPWTGGDYVWLTRFLDRRLGAILTLAAWWLVAATLAPVFGNVLVVEVVDPILAQADWHGTASWFRGRDGSLAASLAVIGLAAGFVAVGMRASAWIQRFVVVIGAVAFVAVLGILATHDKTEFRQAFDLKATEVYGADVDAYQSTLRLGTYDARIRDIDVSSTAGLVPVLLLLAVWIGWAAPLAGEVRGLRPRSATLVFCGAAATATAASLALFVGIGKSLSWEWWNEANNLYWGTVFGSTETALLGAWPNPVMFAGWLAGGTAVTILLLAGMAAWAVGWSLTLFLPATRVLVAAASDGILPARVARMSGDSVPGSALALLVVPACGLAAASAYWDDFAQANESAVVAFALATAATSVAGALWFWRRSKVVAVAATLFTAIVAAAAAAWLADPSYAVHGVGALVFLAAFYALAAGVYLVGSRRDPRSASRPFV